MAAPLSLKTAAASAVCVIFTNPSAALMRLSPLFETGGCLGEPDLARCMLAFLKT